MGDLGDYWKDVKASAHAKRRKQDWISDRYRTVEERVEAVAGAYRLNRVIDDADLKRLAELGIEAERKTSSSFQITLPDRKVMLYTGRKGTFIYIPQDNRKIEVDRWFHDLKEKLATL